MPHQRGEKKEDTTAFSEKYRKASRHAKDVFEKELRHLEIELGSENSSKFRKESKKIFEVFERAEEYIKCYFSIKEAFENHEPLKINGGESIIMLKYDEYNTYEECKKRLEGISEKFEKMENYLNVSDEMEKKLKASEEKCKKLEEKNRDLKRLNEAVNKEKDELEKEKEKLSESEKDLRKELEECKKKISDMLLAKESKKKEAEAPSDQQQVVVGRPLPPRDAASTIRMVGIGRNSGDSNENLTSFYQSNSSYSKEGITSFPNNKTILGGFGVQNYPPITHTSNNSNSFVAEPKKYTSISVIKFLRDEISKVCRSCIFHEYILTKEMKVVFVVDFISYIRNKMDLLIDELNRCYPGIKESTGDEHCTTVDVIGVDTCKSIYHDYLKKIASELGKSGLVVNTFALTYSSSSYPTLKWEFNKL